MPRLVALKSHRYATRMMSAGDEYEATGMHARTLKAVRLATDAPPRRGRPPKPKPSPEVDTASEPEGDRLEDRSNADLRAMAEERGVELPTGYVRNDELIEALRSAGE